ncbi:S1 RNA-binding domain-containing protein 1-like [Amphiura filiformis]|uniref:S1 RNA-binding domain-containing protein 1-like n=1 Tax=Amphiura filiformis TaxID=82378 RepID=UPI003B2198B2
MPPKKSKPPLGDEKAGPSSSKADPSNEVITMAWNLTDMVVQKICEEEPWAVANVLKLLDDGCSIPFISRYRKEMTNGMQAEKIRDVAAAGEELKTVEVKVAAVFKQVTKSGKMTGGLKGALRNARTIEEVEHLYAPYKTGSKTTLAERARKLGLEPAAKVALEEPWKFNLNNFVKPSQKGLASYAEVEKGCQHIIADIISKDKDCLDKIRNLIKLNGATITSTKVKPKKGTEEHPDTAKFANYSAYRISLNSIRPHQVLAINRGENLKILSVKVVLPDNTVNNFKRWCELRWVKSSAPGAVQGLVKTSIEDAYNRLIFPLVVREIRSELTKNAERASIDVFGQNLQRLLLTPPIRGKTVMGVDPGFKHGCKLAVTSPIGNILYTGFMFLQPNNAYAQRNMIAEVLHQHRCETIAIGNGTACRETETYFADLIKNGAFAPLDVMYCIVDESGASIWSVSPDAAKEMPDLDPNLRSAVSIARRLQDPLVELVKIEPKHIGVGMYQHDVSEKCLKDALDGVVEDCVSFVGVDLNVCSATILRRISGLDVGKAKKIIDHRDKNGQFVNREQLLQVKGIGPKTYEQCVGFVRIFTQSSTLASSSHNADNDTKDEASHETLTKTGRKRKAPSSKSKTTKKAKTEVKPNPLDMTCIHPESYHIAEQVLNKTGSEVTEIGHSSIRSKMQRLLQTTSVQELAASLIGSTDTQCGVPTMQLILDGLQQPMDHDIRAEYEKPLFKKSLVSIDDLRRGVTLTGRVKNVVHFGAFVDIGVGESGLLHTSRIHQRLLRRGQPLGLGDKLEVKIINIERLKGQKGQKPKTKIGLDLVAVL